MILTCPSCGTRYQTDSARFPRQGRNVRCAKCTQVWFQHGPGAELEPEPEPVIPAEPEPTPDPPAPRPAPAAAGELRRESFERAKVPHFTPEWEEKTSRPRRSFAFGALIGWLIFLVVAGAVSFAAIAYRQVVADLWPQSATLYSALGLEVNTLGLAFADVTFERSTENSQDILAVHGRIVNVSNRAIPLPMVRIALSDAESHELYQWTVDTGVPTLGAGDQNEFVTRLASPPRQATTIEVRFAESAEQN